MTWMFRSVIVVLRGGCAGPAGVAPAHWIPVLSLAALLLSPAPASAQVAPDGEWRSLETEHFRVTFPTDLPQLGRRAAVRAEAAYALLADSLAPPPNGRIDLVVTDDTDLSNGSATVFPSNRIMVVATPPVDFLSLIYFDDWLDLVIAHELVHILHLDHSGPLGAVVRALLGRAPLVWPLFPGVNTPSWVREGLATWYESESTAAGRGRSPYTAMMLRAAVQEDRLPDPDEMAGISPVWPDRDRPYLYGAAFFEHLASEAGTPGAMAAFVEAYADDALPFRLGGASEDAFGIDLDGAWSRWRDSLRVELASIVRTLEDHGPLTPTDAVTDHGRWALRPAPSPDGGQIAYTRSDGVRESQIHVLEVRAGADGIGVGDSRDVTTQGRNRTRTNGISDFTWLDTDRIAFTQPELRDRYRVRTDLWIVDGSGDARRITDGARLDHPAATPDGAVVAIQSGQGTNRLVEVDPASGGIRPLNDFDPDVHWAYPSVSPDGAWIAASRWSGGWFDVALVDRSGTTRALLTADRAVDLAPSWSPDGEWLLWSSDRSGIWNVLGAPATEVTAAVDGAGGEAAGVAGGVAGEGPELVPVDPVQLTHVVTGALFPAVDPEGRWLYFSGYGAEGWDIQRAPFEPGDALDPMPPLPDGLLAPHRGPAPGPTSAMATARAATGPVPSGESGSGTQEAAEAAEAAASSSYSSFPTVLPRYWLPLIGEGEQAFFRFPGGSVPVDVLGTRYGAQTSGADLLGRHAWAAAATLSEEGRGEGVISYAYAGFGDPVLGMYAIQEWDADARSFTVRGEGGLEEEVVRVVRERSVGAALSFARPRYRDFLGLTVGAAVVRRRSSLLTWNGVESPGPGDFVESERVRLTRPVRSLVEASATLTGDRTRRQPFSISAEDGIGGFLRVEGRVEPSIPAGLQGVAGSDPGYLEGVAELRLYKAVGGPGFANHVLAARGTFGVAGGPDAQAFHFEAGGDRSATRSVGGIAILGYDSSSFPARGFSEGVRFGSRAWSASFEYRFPLLLVNDGWSLLHLDRVHGSLFVDGANAWGPEAPAAGSLPYHNPRRGMIASAGGEISGRFSFLWISMLDLRVGVASPVRGGGDSSVYLRFGAPF